MNTAARKPAPSIARRFVSEVSTWSPAVVELVKTESACYSIEKLERLVGSDPEFSLRVLALANSAFYSQQVQVDTLRNALVVLGDRMVQRLAAGMLARSLVSGSDETQQGIWKNSVAVAVAARMLARSHREAEPERAHIVGLLHNIGRLAILHSEPENYHRLYSAAVESPAEREAMECELFGRSTNELAADIVVMLGLPEYLAEAMLAGHQSGQPGVLGMTLYIAKHLCTTTDFAIGTTDSTPDCLCRYIGKLGLIEEDLEMLALGLAEATESELALYAAGD